MPITDLINIEVVLALPSENYLNTVLPIKNIKAILYFLERRNSVHLCGNFY